MLTPAGLKVLKVNMFQKSKQHKSKVPVRVMDLRGTYKGGGGPDKTILLSAQQHNPERVFVLVTYLRDPRDDEFEIHTKAAQLNINYVDVYDKYLLDLKCVNHLRQLIRKHKIDLVHAHDDKTLLYGWLLKLMDPDLQIMYTCHSHANYTRNDFESWIGNLNFLIRNKIRIFLMKKYSKPILTISEDTKNRLIKNTIKKDDIKVLPNGIDCDHWKNERGRPVLRKEFSIKPDEFLIGTVARIAYDKDLPTFFEVAKAVVGQMPNVKFVIVGDGYGSELEDARTMVNEMKLDSKIIFTGHRNDLLDVYASFDLFLMTSLSEGMPNTVLEAMAMGVPVISTNVGGLSELVKHGKTGFLSEVGDYKCLSEYLLSLLKNHELLTQNAIFARIIITEKFSFKNRVKNLEKYYIQIIDNK